MKIKQLLVGAASLCLFASAAWAGKELLIKVPGKEVYQKIVTTVVITPLYDEPNGAIKDQILSYSMFFKLKPPSNLASKTDWTFLGDGKGNPIGWIKNITLDPKTKKPVPTYENWNTRFVLAPIPSSKFEIIDKETGQSLGLAGEKKITKQGDTLSKELALVTETPSKEQGEDTQYPVTVYTGPILGKEDGSALIKSANLLQDLKMEVVFVIEATQSLQDINIIDSKGIKTTALQVTKEIISGTVKELNKNPEIAKVVRFGLVEFQDDVKEKDFISRVSCDFTNDPKKVLSSLENIQLCKNSGDWPEDIIAGLNTALDMKWSPSSIKHIILIGCSSAHLDKKGAGNDEFGNLGSSGKDLFFGNPRIATNENQGYNSAGLSIAELIKKARPQGGSDSKNDLLVKTFHSIIIGKNPTRFPKSFPFIPKDFVGHSNQEGNLKILKALENITGPDLRIIAEEEFKNQNDEVVNNLATDIRKIFASIGGDISKLEGGQLNIFKIVRRQLFSAYRDSLHYDIGKNQYGLISKNLGSQGYFNYIEPTFESAEKIKINLTENLISAFKIVLAAKNQEPINETDNNVFTPAIFRIRGAEANKGKSPTTFIGFASTRDKDGRETAHKKILVSKDELNRLKSTFDTLYNQFKTKVKKADRQDVASVLNDLKQLIAETGAGDSFGPDVKLDQLITDLPLKTNVLKMTPKDIAIMPSDSFKIWLDNIDFARKRCVTLLDNDQQWFSPSEISASKEFTFLFLTELP